MMRHRGGECDRPSAREHRHEHGEIRKVRAPAVGIVEQIDIARSHGRHGKDANNLADRRDQSPEVDRNRTSLCQRRAVEREERCRGVESFLDDRREHELLSRAVSISSAMQSRR